MKNKIEKYTERITEKEMSFEYGKNDFGYVYVQGEDTPNSHINEALKEAGGKPIECELENYSICGTGKAKPEFLITLKNDPNIVIVIECKNSTKKHQSDKYNYPRDYAIDGVLYYAKYLKKYFNVIAIAVSGSTNGNILTDTFYWSRNQDSFIELNKVKNILLEPNNYLKLIKGERVQKQYDSNEVKNTAILLHNALRINKMNELKPLFIAGILLALRDDSFCNDYDSTTSFDTLLEQCGSAIKRVLNDGEIPIDKIDEIYRKFMEVRTVIGIKSIPLSDDYSLRWYINQLEMKIKPMMDYLGNTIDALGIFYHEFITYSSGDGNALGIVLTPQHLTEFMAELINIDKNSHIIDICCGSGSFLVTSMGIMIKQAKNDKEIDYIRKNNLYGIELDPVIHTLALANMIMRKDGKSNIIHGDCFDEKTISRFRNIKDDKGNNIFINKCLINPPYSQKDHNELEFLEQALSLVEQGGEVAIVCPTSCAIGEKYKDERKRLFEHNTLLAVFTMPNDIFYGQGAGTNVCVMVWKSKVPHNIDVPTFFGYYKDDGFVKKQNLGRVDYYNRWEGIKSKWLKAYRNKEKIAGLSVEHCVTHNDEWLCEAYMDIDYKQLNNQKFEFNLKTLLGYEIIAKKGMIKFPNNYRNSKCMNLNVSKWKKFLIKDIFDEIVPTKGETTEKLQEGYDIPYIAAKEKNNGLKGFVSKDGNENFISDGNCIVFIQLGDGSAGYTTYQPYNFIGMNGKTSCGYSKKLNQYSGVFLKTVLDLQRPKYSYGRSWSGDRLKYTEVKLPVNKNKSIDWKFMENYIKSLPYGKII